jgi:GAF domain-containing protein
LSRSRRLIALVAGLFIAGAIGAVDALAGPHVTIIGTIAAAPFVTAVLGAPLETAVVAAAALGVEFGSGFWDHQFSSWAFYVRAFIVLASGVIAVLAVIDRQHREAARQQFELLTRMSNIGNAPSSAEDTAERLAALFVPQLADICVFDEIRSGSARRLTVRASGSDAEPVEAFLRQRRPQEVADTGGASRMSSGQATLVRQISGEMLERSAYDEADREQLEALQVTSLIAARLQARGEPIGTLTLMATAASRRRYGADDLEFAAVLAGRAALALDNAGLSRRLSQLEQRLVGALGSLADAILVQDASGATIYANDAALQLLGVDSTGELHALPDSLLKLGFDVFDETGEPGTAEQLPSTALLSGASSAPAMLLERASRITGDERWLRVDALPTLDEAGRLLSVVSVLEDVTETKRVELANRLLARASEALSSSLDYEATLRSIAELAVVRLADWCAVSVPDQRGDLRRLAIARAPGAKGSLLRGTLDWNPLGREDAQAVLGDGRSRVLNDISDELLRSRATEPGQLELWRQHELTAAMVVPLSAAGRVVGVMSLAIARPGRRFSDADLALAEEVGRRAGRAIENARSYTARSTIAETLQQALRPPELVPPPGWTLACWYVPAGEESTVGGDFYDLFPVADGHVVFVGDVTGHGAVAARLTGLARFTLRTAAELTQDPRMAVHRLDAALLAQPETSPVSTVCAHLGTLDNGRVLAHFAVAGHPLPLLLRGGQLREVARGGTLAGAATRGDWPDSEVELQQGDTVVFYTDGITEARHGGELFGRERLDRCLLAGSPEPRDVVARLKSELEGFHRPGSRDDVTVLVMRLVGVEQPTEAQTSAPTPRRRRAPLRRPRARRS